ncbi:MAG TPA: hypothetical protein VH600_23630 [Burkholderiales bacterium]|jgi:hypothetical protein
MRCLLLAAVVAALAPFHAALAQEANTTQMETITEIFRCMAQGLPEDWVSADMIVELEHPGDSTGKVRYRVFRKDATDTPESFTPCNTDGPPKALIGLRQQEPQERQGWTTARLVLERDGNFRLNYDFPPK